MSPDTQQNIFYTIVFIFIHNFAAIFYLLGIIIATLLMFYRPTRGKLLILWGFTLLLFSFEYSKHILEPLKEQTLNSLITERESIRIEYYVSKFLTRIVPFVLPLMGWGLVIIGIFFDRIYKRLKLIFTN